MLQVIQSHSFPAENQNEAGTFLKVGVAVATVSSMALADDPTWYTELQTTLSWIATAVLAVLSVVIGIRLAPLAWVHIKRVLYR
jgi:hypothetical protein